MSDPASSTPDPALHALTATNPMSDMSRHAQAPEGQADTRDNLFGGVTEQSYSAPSAPLLSSPVDSDPDTKAMKQEDAAKSQAIKPLG